MAAAPYVDDEATILTLSGGRRTRARAPLNLRHYSVCIGHICIVDDFGDYGYSDVATASYSIYHAQSLGCIGHDGILLLLVCQP